MFSLVGPSTYSDLPSGNLQFNLWGQAITRLAADEQIERVGTDSDSDSNAASARAITVGFLCHRVDANHTIVRDFKAKQFAITIQVDPGSKLLKTERPGIRRLPVWCRECPQQITQVGYVCEDCPGYFSVCLECMESINECDDGAERVSHDETHAWETVNMVL